MEAVNRLPGLLCDERDELTQCIAIAVLGVAGEIAVGDDLLEEETPNPGAKRLRSHEKAPMAPCDGSTRCQASIPLFD
jgi:hypothetical protein